MGCNLVVVCHSCKEVYYFGYSSYTNADQHLVEYFKDADHVGHNVSRPADPFLHLDGNKMVIGFSDEMEPDTVFSEPYKLIQAEWLHPLQIL